MSGHGEMRCREVAGGTEFHVHIHGRPSGLSRLLLPLLRRDTIRLEQRRLTTMKQLMESGELIAPPPDSQI